tara:strand:+ start:411 stop:872 length:462 start_codon:yes stop_codon:yes gene_type:complete
MGTVTEWADGGTNDIGLNSLASGEFSVGSQVSLGTDFEPTVFAWRMKIDFNSAVNAGESIQVYAAAARDGDATVIDGGFDGDGTESDLDNRDRLNNLKHIGNVYGDDATGNDFQGSGQFTWWERYFVPVILNETGTAFHSSGHSFEIEDLTTI